MIKIRLIPRALACLLLGFVAFSAVRSVHAQTTRTWDGGPAGTGFTVTNGTNWSGDTLPTSSSTTSDTARFDGTVSGALSLVLSANLGGTTSNRGINLQLTTSQTSPVSIDTTGSTRFDIRVQDLTVAAGAGALTIGNGVATVLPASPTNPSLRVVLGGGTGASHSFVNNSNATVTFETEVQIVNGNGVSQPLTLDGTGDWNIKGTLFGSVPMQYTKLGTGTLRVSGINSYTGNTAVNGGRLLVNTAVSGTNSGTGSGSVSVGGSGLLGGTGQITPVDGPVSVANGGTMAPGDGGIGTLTLNGSTRSGTIVSLASGAQFSFELNSGLQADRIALANGAAGDFSFGGNTINFSDLAGGTLSEGTYTLFTAAANNNFTGLTVDGSGFITSGLTIGTGLEGYGDANLQLLGGTIYLNLVPEPGPGLLFVCGVVGLALRRRSPKRQT